MKTTIGSLFLGTLLAGCASAPALGISASSQATSGNGTVCMPIQRGVNGAVADTRVAERWPEETYGAQAAAFAGNVGNAARYVLIDFDLRAIPPNAEVTRATLTMHANTNECSARSDITLHRITTAWNEGTASWASFGSAFDPYVESKLQRHTGDGGAAS